MEIDRLLLGLGPRVRQAFILSQFDGLSYPQIAAQLGISLRSVNKHMAKAMEHCCLMQMQMQLAAIDKRAETSEKYLRQIAKSLAKKKKRKKGESDVEDESSDDD